jgi:general secretion pathway protein D
VHTHQGEKLRDQGDMSGAMTEFMRALEIDPSNELAQQDIRLTKEKIAASPTNTPAETPQSETPMAEISSPAELKPTSDEPITIHAFEGGLPDGGQDRGYQRALRSRLHRQACAG